MDMDLDNQFCRDCQQDKDNCPDCYEREDGTYSLYLSPDSYVEKE
jgi:hypothetical protein